MDEIRKPTRVMHLIATNFVGGPEKQILNHLECCDRDRYEVHAGSFIEKGNGNDFLDRAADLNVPTCPVPESFPFDPRALLFLRRYIARQGIEVLITHGYKPNILGHLALLGQNVGHAMYVRGWTAENRKIMVYNWLDKKFLFRADLVVTVAQRKVPELRELGLPADRIRCIRNAARALQLEAPARSLASFFDGTAPDPLFLAAGRISSEKGHIFLVKALEILRDRGLNPGCVLFGEGPDGEQIAREIKLRKLEKNIILAGYDAGWKNWIPEADFVINPSLSEVMPNVVLESMISGCPVVATDVGGVRELIENETLGWCVPPGSPEALARAVEDYLHRRPERQDILARARDHVLQNFTFASQAERLHELYAELRRD